MRFSVPFLGALLATSAIAYPSEAGLFEREAALVPRAAPLTWNPSSKSQTLYTKFCATKYSKSKRDLEVRAKPAGATEVTLGNFLSAKPNEPTLWTGGLGTCVGIALTGKAGSSGKTRFLFHMSLGASAQEVRDSWNRFATAVQSSGITGANAIIYTVETRQNVLTDPDLKNEASYVEPDYANIANACGQLIGAVCGRRYHGWDQVGEMSILSNNAIGIYVA